MHKQITQTDGAKTRTFRSSLRAVKILNRHGRSVIADEFLPSVFTVGYVVSHIKR